MPYGLEYRPGTTVHICHASSALPASVSSVGLTAAGEVDTDTRWVAAARRLKLHQTPQTAT